MRPVMDRAPVTNVTNVHNRVPIIVVAANHYRSGPVLVTKRPHGTHWLALGNSRAERGSLAKTSQASRENSRELGILHHVVKSYEVVFHATMIRNVLCSSTKQPGLSIHAAHAHSGG